MQTTITPTAERSITIVRRPIHRPHHVHRQSATYAKASIQQPITRSSVADAFRKMANGVDASIAEGQTKAFYQSGGQDWARALNSVDARELKSRVVDAFRQMAHGVQHTEAHASALRFYRSGGQAWAKNLG